MIVFNFKTARRVIKMMGMIGISCFISIHVVQAENMQPAVPYPAAVKRDLGAQDADQGGLPHDFWSDVAIDLVSPLMVQLPSQQPLAIAKLLQQRLLISNALPPDGIAANEWLALRLDRLVAMRAYHQAAQIYYLAWRFQTMPEAAELALISLYIAANEQETACLRYMAVRDHAQSTDWQWIYAYCAQRFPQLTGQPTPLPENDIRAALLAKLSNNIQARSEFLQAMVPVWYHVPPLPADEKSEKKEISKINATAWLETHTKDEPAFMYLYGLLALAESSSNKSLVYQRWMANDLVAEAQSLNSGVLPPPPPEE